MTCFCCQFIILVIFNQVFDKCFRRIQATSGKILLFWFQLYVFLQQNKQTLLNTAVDETEVLLLALLEYEHVDLEDEVADVDEVLGQISLDVDDSDAVEVVAEEGSDVNL